MLLAANAAKDLSILLGKPWDESILWMGTYLKNVAFTQTVLSKDIPDIPAAAIALIANMPKLSSVGDLDLFAKRFNACFKAIVKEELSRGRGSKLDPSFCLSEENILLFDGFAYYMCPQEASFSSISISTCRPWQDLVKGIASYVASTVAPAWKKEEWESLTLLDSNQYYIAESIVAGTYVPGEEMEDARRRKGKAPADRAEDAPAKRSRPAPWWMPDRQDGDPSSTLDGGEEYPMTGHIAVTYGVIWSEPAPKRLLEALDGMAFEHPESATSYHPSKMWYMDAAKMDRDQKRFYIQWRYEVANGIYSDSDHGYLKLLLTDAVATIDDSARCLELLIGLYRAYSAQDSYIKNLLSRICTDYAILTQHDPPIEATGQERDFILSQKLQARPLGRISMDLMSGFKGVNTKKYVHQGYDYDTALNAVVDALDKKSLKMTSKTLYSSFKDSEIALDRNMMPRIIHSWPKYIRFKMIYVSDTDLGTKLSAAMRAAIIAVNEAFGLDCPGTSKSVAREEMEFMLKVARSSLSSIRSERENAERSKRLASITIDTGAVADAESALETVKKLMTVEAPDEAAEPEPAKAPEPAAPAGGWPALASALDDEQKGYLSACLENSGKAFLDGIGKKAPKMEDSINSLSMDLVGDQIVESGEVFEDYEEDVRRILGRGSRGMDHAPWNRHLV